MDDIEIAAIPKNGREELRISLSEFKGHRLLQFRVWFVPSGGGDYRPGTSGFAVKVEKIDNLARALVDARSEARKIGWLE